jgi:hypothetical protein
MGDPLSSDILTIDSGNAGRQEHFQGNGGEGRSKVDPFRTARLSCGGKRSVGGLKLVGKKHCGAGRPAPVAFLRGWCSTNSPGRPALLQVALEGAAVIPSASPRPARHLLLLFSATPALPSHGMRKERRQGSFGANDWRNRLQQSALPAKVCEKLLTPMQESAQPDRTSTH